VPYPAKIRMQAPDIQSISMMDGGYVVARDERGSVHNQQTITSYRIDGEPGGTLDVTIWATVDDRFFNDASHQMAVHFHGKPKRAGDPHTALPILSIRRIDG
jgi:hypothetical protein